jgi:hypothetical protein
MYSPAQAVGGLTWGAKEIKYGQARAVLNVLAQYLYGVEALPSPLLQKGLTEGWSEDVRAEEGHRNNNCAS